MALFRWCPPIRYASPATEHLSLHRKSLCNNMARASGDADNMQPQNSEGSTNGTDPN